MMKIGITFYKVRTHIIFPQVILVNIRIIQIIIFGIKIIQDGNHLKNIVMNQEILYSIGILDNMNYKRWHIPMKMECER